MLAFLETSSYGGLCAGASHWKGTVRVDGCELFRVERDLSRAEAARLNRDDRKSLGALDYKWKAGQPSERFFTEDEVAAQAVLMCREYPEITVLLKGHSASCDPKPVLIGSDSLKAQSVELIAEAEANNWWDGDNDVMEAIYERWTKALNDCTRSKAGVDGRASRRSTKPRRTPVRSRSRKKRDD